VYGNEFMSELCEREFGRQSSHKVHVRVKQRTGRKSITTATGLSTAGVSGEMMNMEDMKVLVKRLKKRLNCNGSVIEHETHGLVLQLSGDQRFNLFNFLIENRIRQEHQIVIHGG